MLSLLAPIAALAASWEASATARQRVTPGDPGAATLLHCTDDLRAALDLLETSLAYLSSAEYGLLHGVTAQTVRTWCARGLLPGSVRAGYEWRIPRATRPPAGRRTGAA